MSTSSKIIKAGGVEPSPFETSISQALVELENHSDLKTHLRELYITRVKEIDFGNKKVCIPTRYSLSYVHLTLLIRILISVDHHLCTDAQIESVPKGADAPRSRIGKKVQRKTCRVHRRSQNLVQADEESPQRLQTEASSF